MAIGSHPSKYFWAHIGTQLLTGLENYRLAQAIIIMIIMIFNINIAAQPAAAV
jgi:hypothetical protein